MVYWSGSHELNSPFRRIVTGQVRDGTAQVWAQYEAGIDEDTITILITSQSGQGYEAEKVAQIIDEVKGMFGRYILKETRVIISVR